MCWPGHKGLCRTLSTKVVESVALDLAIQLRVSLDNFHLKRAKAQLNVKTTRLPSRWCSCQIQYQLVTNKVACWQWRCVLAKRMRHWCKAKRVNLLASRHLIFAQIGEILRVGNHQLKSRRGHQKWANLAVP